MPFPHGLRSLLAVELGTFGHDQEAMSPAVICSLPLPAVEDSCGEGAIRR